MKFNKIFPEKKNSGEIRGIFENCRRRVGIHLVEGCGWRSNTRNIKSIKLRVQCIR